MTAHPQKRSLTIAGHRTSVSLEADFWEALKEVAKAENKSSTLLITEIDRRRGDRGLSSAIRSYLLQYYRRLHSP